jgi:predicted RNA binding protein YcfA (HicA-like mRNA interferase family)
MLYLASVQSAAAIRSQQGKTVPQGTLRAILRDADISVEEFLKLL